MGSVPINPAAVHRNVLEEDGSVRLRNNRYYPARRVTMTCRSSFTVGFAGRGSSVLTGLSYALVLVGAKTNDMIRPDTAGRDASANAVRCLLLTVIRYLFQNRRWRPRFDCRLVAPDRTGGPSLKALSGSLLPRRDTRFDGFLRPW